MSDRNTMAVLVLFMLCAFAMLSVQPEGSTYDPLGEGVECYECGKTFLWDSDEAVRDMNHDFCCPECAESCRANLER